MKMKHAKQHISSMKESVSFDVSPADKWGNQILVASLGGKELSRSVNLSSERDIQNAKDKILNQIKQYI